MNCIEVAETAAPEPTLPEADPPLGAVPVLDSCTGATANLPLDGYVSLRSSAKKQPAALAAFRSALRQAQAIASQQGPVRSTLQGSVGMSVQAASLISLGQYPTAMNAGDLQRIVKLMFLFNVIPSVNNAQLPVQPMILR